MILACLARLGRSLLGVLAENAWEEGGRLELVDTSECYVVGDAARYVDHRQEVS